MINELKQILNERKITLDIDWDGSSKERLDSERKYKLKLKPHNNGANVTGDKKDILKYLLSKDYGMDKADVEDLFPELYESKDANIKKFKGLVSKFNKSFLSQKSGNKSVESARIKLLQLMKSDPTKLVAQELRSAASLYFKILARSDNDDEANSAESDKEEFLRVLKHINFIRRASDTSSLASKNHLNIEIK